MKYRYASRLLMALLVAMASAAHADFVVERAASADARKPKAAVEPAEKTVATRADAVTFIGETPVNVDMAKGMGRDLTLGEAINQFVPDGFQINASECAYRGRVNWRGGKPWPDVLAQMLAVSGCSAVVNWDDRTLTVKKIDQTKAVAVARQWKVLRSDKYLSITVDRWAKDNGWQGVAWQVPGGRDFVVDFEATFSGTFESALTELMRSTQKTDLPLQARTSPQNRVVRVVPFGREGGDAKKQGDSK